MGIFRPQKEFPLLEEYAKVFAITERTIFAYDNIIYTNYDLPNDLVVHEKTHFKQQEKYGLVDWVEKYLKDPTFRLDMELDAYKKQLASIKDREWRNRVRLVSARDLSSDLYSNIINYHQALKLLM